MEEQNKNRIFSNLHFLCQNTTDLPALLTLLGEKNIISQEEIQKIQSEKTPYEKHLSLFTIVTKKDGEAFLLLLKCLKTSGNHSAIRILEQQLRNNHNECLIWFEIDQSRIHYKGRDDELQKIHEYYLKSCKDESLMFIAITGLGGIGKSGLAKEYAKKFFKEVVGHCVWINAETKDTSFKSLQRLAKKLNISIENGTGNEKDTESLIAETCEKLSTQKYMLVFDNLESYTEDVLKSFVEYAVNLSPNKIKPFVLMTSRDQTISQTFGDMAKPIALTILQNEAAVALFKEALSIKETDIKTISLVQEICKKLEYFPLAIQQTIAYIIEKQRGADQTNVMTEFLGEYDIATKKFLAHPLPSYQTLDATSRTTYFVWQITMDKIGTIQGVGFRAQQALNVISLFYSDNINREFVNKILDNFFNDCRESPSKSSKTDVFEILVNFSMCQTCLDDPYLVSVHRLVQDVNRIQLEENEKLIETIDVLLKSIKIIFNEGCVSLPEIVHIRILLNHAWKMKNRIDKQSYACILDIISNIYYDEGRYAEAFQFDSEAIEQLIDLFSLESRHTLRMKCWKGGILREQGEFENGLKLLMEVHSKQRELFGEEDPHTIRTAGDIGYLYFLQNKNSEANEWLTKALQSCHTKCKEDDRLLLGIKDDIANVLRAEGNLEKSLQLHNEVYQIKLSRLGKDHKSTLTTESNIADILAQDNKFDEALKAYQDVLDVRQRKLGNKHPDTLYTKQEMALVFYEQGNFDQAFELIKEVLEIRQEELGNEHPNTLNAKHNIACVLEKQQKYEEAINMFQQVLEVGQKVIGDEHPDTLKTKLRIANMLQKQEKFKEALTAYQQLLDVQRRILGEDHELTVEVVSNIAFIEEMQ